MAARNAKALVWRPIVYKPSIFGNTILASSVKTVDRHPIRDRAITVATKPSKAVFGNKIV